MGCLAIVILVPVMIVATPFVLVLSLFDEGPYLRRLDERYGRVGRATLRALGLVR